METGKKVKGVIPVKKDASKANIFAGHSKMSYSKFKEWFDRHYFGDIEPHLEKLGIQKPSK